MHAYLKKHNIKQNETNINMHVIINTVIKKSTTLYRKYDVIVTIQNAEMTKYVEL